VDPLSLTATTTSETSAHGPRRGSKHSGSPPSTGIKRERLTGSLLAYRAKAETPTFPEWRMSPSATSRHAEWTSGWATCVGAWVEMTVIP
jgi:hypothetical protein